MNLESVAALGVAAGWRRAGQNETNETKRNVSRVKIREKLYYEKQAVDYSGISLERLRRDWEKFLHY